MTREINISDKQRLLEILAVVLTAIGKFVFMDFLNWRFPFVAFAVVCWTAYIIYRSKQTKGILKYWGFRKDNFKATVKLMLPFGMLSVVSFFAVGYYQDTINCTWHIIPLLITYPIWGTIQQFLTIGLIAGNLNDLKSVRIHKFLIIVISSILFSIVHFPSVWLMTGTFFLALFYGIVYLKSKNVFAMGLIHGWLGALFYYTVVNRDPFQEIFMRYLL